MTSGEFPETPQSDDPAPTKQNELIPQELAELRMLGAWGLPPKEEKRALRALVRKRLMREARNKGGESVLHRAAESPDGGPDNVHHPAPDEGANAPPQKQDGGEPDSADLVRPEVEALPDKDITRLLALKPSPHASEVGALPISVTPSVAGRLNSTRLPPWQEGAAEVGDDARPDPLT